MSLIPMTKDLAGLIDPNAGRVENRSLLLEKFVIPKSWPNRKWNNRLNDADRYTILRISENGHTILHGEAGQIRARRNQNDRDQMNLEAIHSAVQIRPEAPDAKRLRREHSERFIRLATRSLGENAIIFCARLRSRLAINLSDGIIENGGIALDRLFGLPYIPGSAVKGNARHAALAEIDNASEAERPELLKRFVSVFGAVASEWDNRKSIGSRNGDPKERRDQKGGVSFLAAYPANEKVALNVDLTNVHTPDYYVGRNAGNPNQLANERLRPNYFPVVEPGAAFSFVIALNTIGLQAENPQQILSDAKRWLEEALTVHGIGAKTGAGYGWFEIAPEILESVLQNIESEPEKGAEESADSTPPADETDSPGSEGSSEEEKAKQKIKSAGIQEFANFVADIAEKSEFERKAIVEELRTERKDRWRTWKRSKKPNDKKRVEEVLKVIENDKLEPLP